MAVSSQNLQIKLLYPSIIGPVTESDLDKLLQTLRKNEDIWPFECTLVAPLTEVESQSGGSPSAKRTSPLQASGSMVTSIYSKTATANAVEDTIVVEIVSNVSDAAIMRKVFDAIGVIVKETLLEQKNIKNNVRVQILNMSPER